MMSATDPSTTRRMLRCCRHISGTEVWTVRAAVGYSLMNGSAVIHEDGVAATFAVVLDALHFVRLPALEFKVVSDDAGSLFQLLFENGPQFGVEFGEQVDGDHIGRTVILFRRVGADDARGFLQLLALDLGD